MASLDLHNNIHATVGLAPVAITDTFQSAIVDTANYGSTEFVIMTGVMDNTSSRTFAVTLSAGDNSALSDGAAPGATEMLGTTTAAGFTYADDGEIRRIGYIGAKRYVQLTATASGAIAGSPVAILVLQTGARVGPEAASGS